MVLTLDLEFVLKIDVVVKKMIDSEVSNILSQRLLMGEMKHHNNATVQ